MSVKQTFLKACQKDCYWSPESRILLAVSGGVDSMVLLDLVSHLPPSIKPWFAVVHFNHQLREVSDIEEQFLQSYCLEGEIPFYSKRWESVDLPQNGVEAAARSARYTYFQLIMEQVGATHLVTAHHGDDQVETILMRLVRGSHLIGISGIKTKRPFAKGILVRPLLSSTKKELVSYSQQYAVPYYEDESNQNLMYTRNRYRNEIVPLLRKENTNLVEHFMDFSDDLSDIISLVQPLINEVFKQVVKIRSPEYYEVDFPELITHPKEMQRQVVSQLLSQLADQNPFEYKREHINQIVDLANDSKSNSYLTLPEGFICRKGYQLIVISKELNEPKKAIDFTVILEMNQWQNLPNGDRIGLFNSHMLEDSVPGLKIYLDCHSVQLPLTVRHRQDGDRMSIKGLNGGTKKIKDILIDQKIPIEERNSAYLVTDLTKKIIWLVKYKESQLSIGKETDKIQYILVYQNHELY